MIHCLKVNCVIFPLVRQAGFLAPNLCHWFSQCYAGSLKQTEQCFVTTTDTLFKKYEWLTYSFLCILNCHFKQEKNTQFIFNCQTNQLISHLLKADFHINMFTPSLFSFTPWFTTHRHIHTHKHTAVLIY